MKKFFTFVGLVSSVAFINAQIVINEIYTGGGILGATLTHDFIELKNIGSSSATLSGATLQYGSVNGQFTQYHNIPTVTIPAGQTFLIQEGGDGGGIINLLNPNLVVNAVINFDGSGPIIGVGIGLALTSGKVALASNATRVTGPTASNVIDFVGYGLATQFEGPGAAPSPSILNSISRVAGDTNHNAADFTVSLPTPQAGTGVVLAVNEGQNSPSQFIKNTLVKNNELMFGSDVKDVKIYSMSGQLVKTANVKGSSTLNIADLPKGNYIVTGIVNNKNVTERVLKQ